MSLLASTPAAHAPPQPVPDHACLPVCLSSNPARTRTVLTYRDHVPIFTHCAVATRSAKFQLAPVDASNAGVVDLFKVASRQHHRGAGRHKVRHVTYASDVGIHASSHPSSMPDMRICSTSFCSACCPHAHSALCFPDGRCFGEYVSVRSLNPCPVWAPQFNLKTPATSHTQMSAHLCRVSSTFTMPMLIVC